MSKDCPKIILAYCFKCSLKNLAGLPLKRRWKIGSRPGSFTDLYFSIKPQQWQKDCFAFEKIAISTFVRNDPRANSSEARKVRAVLIDDWCQLLQPMSGQCTWSQEISFTYQAGLKWQQNWSCFVLVNNTAFVLFQDQQHGFCFVQASTTWLLFCSNVNNIAVQTDNSW